ncbi:hypothetical protein GCM10023149_47960 [Mucilaginibacter gynuensis]|uniref:HTH araC/xylS-type domain-containing protein n=1 Tax=Mucilaginibacter gynuensis TaxID=1302236 RepID=A0ABP8HE73_9SPHI
MDYSKTLRNNNKIYSRTSSRQNAMQCSSDFNIRFVLSGNESYQIGRRNLSIYPDSFLILNKGTHYASSVGSNDPAQSFSINFDQQFLNDFKNSHEQTDRSLLEGQGYLQRQEDEFNETIYPFKGDIRYNIFHLKSRLDNGLQDEMLINEYLHHCLINYYKIYNTEVLEKAGNLNFLNSSTRVEILRRLNMAKEFLYTNFNSNISLEDLAEHACLSVNHLLRTFKQAFKLTPHQFLVQLRLQRAQQLLKTTKYPINEVVSMVGFECPSSFIRLFRTHYKLTPLKYRMTA